MEISNGDLCLLFGKLRKGGALYLAKKEAEVEREVERLTHIAVSEQSVRPQDWDVACETPISYALWRS
jgi:hypothetical protein